MPTLIDLFCCQGGASMGYHQAGFQVIGVDIEPQPNYPFPFIQADVLSLDPTFLALFDVIAASPPCKVHTRMKAFSGEQWTDLIEPTRALLRASGKLYVMENVPEAPLIDPLILCGSMFGYDIRRHRHFESNVPLIQPECRHAEQEANSPGYRTMRYHSGKPVEHRVNVVSVYGRGNGYGPGETELWRSVMAMPWASKDGLREAIPPYYTTFIGLQLMPHIPR